MTSPSTVFLVLSLLVHGCAYVTSEEYNDDDYSDLSYGINKFSGGFVDEMTKANQNKSIIISSLSVIYVLFMTYLGASGRTAYELIEATSVYSFQATDQFTALTHALNNLGGVTFTMANKIYVKSGEDYKIDDDYKENVIDIVKGEVESINFNQNAKAAKKINTWVEKQTHNKIKDLIQPEDLDSTTRLVLLNAIYFKGTWQKTFDNKATRPRSFHVTKKRTVKVPTMTMKAKLEYSEDDYLDCKLLKLDYVGGNVSMVIFLPNEVDGIDALNEKIRRDSDAVYRPVKNLKFVEVDVRIPKFKTETEVDLKELLPKLAVRRIFDPIKSRLDGMLEDPQPLHVSKMIQKAVIEINEVGSEAAAATAAVIVGLSSVIEPQEKKLTFYADHPYHYGILNKGQVALFGGVFNGL